MIKDLQNKTMLISKLTESNIFFKSLIENSTNDKENKKTLELILKNQQAIRKHFYHIVSFRRFQEL